MYQRNKRIWCAVMLLVSIGLRVCMFFGLDQRLTALAMDTVKNQSFTEFLLMLETGRRMELSQEPPEPELVVLHRMAPVAAEVPPEPEPELPAEPVLLPTALAEAGCLKIVGGCTYDYDKAALLARPTAMELSREKGTILIVHAHTTEAYLPCSGWEYAPTAPFRTLDPERSVAAVGEALARVLREAGYAVIHDTTVHDYPDYNSSYWNALQTIEAWKEQVPDIQMVIDVHRDAAEDAQGNALPLNFDLGEEQAAQVMLVVGTCQGGLEHPGWEENLANALKLQSVLDGMYPGLCRKLDLRTERFNQHTAPGAILVEVGTQGNTLEQALRSAELMGDAMVRTLNALELGGGTLHPEKIP